MIEIPNEGGPFSVSAGQVRALSPAGKAWFAATARNANAWKKRCAVTQDLAEGKRAVDAAKADTVRDTPRLNRYMAHVVAFWALEAERDAGNAANAQGITEWRPRTSFIATRISAHNDRIRAMGEAQWFAFDDAGKVVLSLSCSRDHALDVALGYNKAGGRLVLLAPEPILDDADLADCVAIPEERPPVVAPKEDPLVTFAGEDGLLVVTPHGTVAFGRTDDGKVADGYVLVDPARAGAVGYPEAPIEKAIRNAVKHDIDPKPAAVAEWCRDVAEADHVTLAEGKLPKPELVALKKGPPRSMIRWTVPDRGGHPRTVVADPGQVREVLKGSRLARVDVVQVGDAWPVRIVRADGIVAYLSAWNVVEASP